MVVVYAITLALDLPWLRILAVLLGYLVLVALYELYVGHRFRKHERAAKRRARRTETGLYGWPRGEEGVAAPASAVTVRTRPVTVAPSVSTRADVEPLAPALEPELEPFAAAASDDPGWPESAPVVDDEPEPQVEEPAPVPVVEAAPFEEPAPEPE